MHHKKLISNCLNKRVILLILLTLVMLNCKNKETLTLVIPKTTKVTGNPLNEKGLQIKGEFEIRGDFTIKTDTTKNVITLMKPDGNGITGTFNCGCGAIDGGACKLVTTDISFYCSDFICNNCIMEIVILGGDFKMEFIN